VISAPIALFIFNRPAHLRKTIASLSACDGFDASRVVVFADGPRHEKEAPLVAEARSVARQLLGSEAAYQESAVNKGLAASISSGVRNLTEQHGRVIVVEDDLSLAPHFLTYMNGALDRYAAAQNVFQVSGHSFNPQEFSDRKSAVMLPFTTTWGWATWDRAWRQFDVTASGWEQLAHDGKLRRRFNLDGVYDYASMLEDQMSGRRDSWGIKWYWTVFKAGGISVFPPWTMVRNDGMDGSGSHGRGRFRSFANISADDRDGGFVDYPEPILIPEDVDAMRRAIWRQNGGQIGRFIDFAKRTIKRYR
jgi:hypothetical protein